MAPGEPRHGPGARGAPGLGPPGASLKLFTVHGTAAHEDALEAFLHWYGALPIDGGLVVLTHVLSSSYEEGITCWAVVPGRYAGEA